MPSGRSLSQTMGQARWLARDNLETNPITIKPETAGHMREWFSWAPFSCCSPPTCPFSISLFFVSTCLSWDTSLLSVTWEPTLRPWKGPPSYYKTTEADALISCLLPLAPFLTLTLVVGLGDVWGWKAKLISQRHTAFVYMDTDQK